MRLDAQGAGAPDFPADRMAKALRRCRRKAHRAYTQAMNTAAELRGMAGLAVEGHPSSAFNGVYTHVSEHKGWPVFKKQGAVESATVYLQKYDPDRDFEAATVKAKRRQRRRQRGGDGEAEEAAKAKAERVGG